jgi:hypothetical protein
MAAFDGRWDGVWNGAWLGTDQDAAVPSHPVGYWPWRKRRKEIEDAERANAEKRWPDKVREFVGTEIQEPIEEAIAQAIAPTPKPIDLTSLDGLLEATRRFVLDHAALVAALRTRELDAIITAAIEAEMALRRAIRDEEEAIALILLLESAE